MTMDTFTVINFNKEISAISNFSSLPLELQAEIKSSEQIVVRGFQELYGIEKREDGRYQLWSAGGYWTGRSDSDKFIIDSYGSKKYQWDGQALRKACISCGVFQ